MNNQFSKILYTKEEIEKRIKELAIEINTFYKHTSNVLFVPILDGSLVFSGKLLLDLDFDLEVYSTKISSYSFNKKSNGKPKIITPFTEELVKGKDILLVDDMIDTGHTLKLFSDYLISLGAKSVKVCILFNKKVNKRIKEVNLDFVGLDIPDEWVAGYGVDSCGKLRNFKHFGIVK